MTGIDDNGICPRDRGLRYLARGKRFSGQIDATQLGHHIADTIAGQGQPGMCVLAGEKVNTATRTLAFGLPRKFIATDSLAVISETTQQQVFAGG